MRHSNNARRRRLRALLGAAAPAAGACALLLFMPPAASRAADATAALANGTRAHLTYSHLPPVLSGRSPLRDTDAALSIEIEFALKPRNAEQIQPLLNALYNSNSPKYGHYLTQAEYRSRFSPTPDQVNAVVAYAKSQGLTVTGVSTSGMLVRTRGTAAQMDSAFGVTLRDFVSPDPRDNNRIFHAPDREPTLDASIAPLLNGIVGLSNAAVPHNHLRKFPLPAHFVPNSATRATTSAVATPRANDIVSKTAHGTVIERSMTIMATRFRERPFSWSIRAQAQPARQL